MRPPASQKVDNPRPAISLLPCPARPPKGPTATRQPQPAALIRQTVPSRALSWPCERRPQTSLALQAVCLPPSVPLVARPAHLPKPWSTVCLRSAPLDTALRLKSSRRTGTSGMFTEPQFPTVCARCLPLPLRRTLSPRPQPSCAQLSLYLTVLPLLSFFSVAAVMPSSAPSSQVGSLLARLTHPPLLLPFLLDHYTNTSMRLNHPALLSS